MRIAHGLLVVAVVVWLPARVATAYTISLVEENTFLLRTSANDKVNLADRQTRVPTTLPYVESVTASDGGTSASTQYDFSNDAFSITFEHTRVDTYDSYGQSFGRVFFTVDQDISYVATGYHSATDPEGRSVTLSSSLTDTGTRAVLYDSVQWSEQTPNKSLTLGLTEGDTYNVDIGSLGGTLTAGHEYLFIYGARVRTLPTASTLGATGSGYFNLSFASVPEPSTGILLALGLAAVSASRRRPALPRSARSFHDLE